MDQDHIKTIEDRRMPEVISLLKKHGLGAVRRRKYQDYEWAKRICFEGLFINSQIYDKHIGWICDYLKI